jgi:hypothetical protein
MAANISTDDFRRVQGNQAGEALIAAMQVSPDRNIDIEPKRAPFPVRDVALCE